MCDLPHPWGVFPPRRTVPNRCINTYSPRLTLFNNLTLHANLNIHTNVKVKHIRCSGVRSTLDRIKCRDNAVSHTRGCIVININIISRKEALSMRVKPSFIEGWLKGWSKKKTKRKRRRAHQKTGWNYSRSIAPWGRELGRPEDLSSWCTNSESLEIIHRLLVKLFFCFLFFFTMKFQLQLSCSHNVNYWLFS